MILLEQWRATTGSDVKISNFEEKFSPNYPYIKSLSDGTRVRVVSLLREQIPAPCDENLGSLLLWHTCFL